MADRSRETSAAFDALEMSVALLGGVFREIAAGTPLDPQRAENLAAHCAMLRRTLVESRRNLAGTDGELSEADWQELAASPIPPAQT